MERIRDSSMPVAHARRSVRAWGGILFAVILAEGILGVASAGPGESGGAPLLVAHVGLGVVVAGVTGWVGVNAWQVRRRAARVATGFSAAAVAATGATGAAFLVTGFAEGAVVDRALALSALAGTVLMMVYGSPEVAVER